MAEIIPGPFKITTIIRCVQKSVKSKWQKSPNAEQYFFSIPCTAMTMRPGKLAERQYSRMNTVKLAAWLHG